MGGLDVLERILKALVIFGPYGLEMVGMFFAA